MKRKQVKGKPSIQDADYLGLEGIREMREEDRIGTGILSEVLVFILNRGFKNVYTTLLQTSRQQRETCYVMNQR